MRYLGIDYGSKRVGCAVSSEGIAFPLSVIANDATLFSTLRGILEKERVGEIVVGDTRAYGGGENSITRDVEQFIERLREESTIPVHSAWEAGSSVEASRYAPQGSAKDDSAAAAIILQRYLDMRGNGGIL